MARPSKELRQEFNALYESIKNGNPSSDLAHFRNVLLKVGHQVDETTEYEALDRALRFGSLFMIQLLVDKPLENKELKKMETVLRATSRAFCACIRNHKRELARVDDASLPFKKRARSE
jgi:hypothetical protein